VNAAFKAEVNLLANLILTDYARVVVVEPECRCDRSMCIHDSRYELRMVDVHGDESCVDFLDSETVREADRRAAEIRGNKWLARFH
jgi:hypothetical protein